MSWSTILRKRLNYRLAFDAFEVEKVARYDQAKIAELLSDAGIVRNKLKVNSAVTNAQAFLTVQEEFGSFDKYLWGFVHGKPRINNVKSIANIPANQRF